MIAEGSASTAASCAPLYTTLDSAHVSEILLIVADDTHALNRNRESRQACLHSRIRASTLRLLSLYA